MFLNESKIHTAESFFLTKSLWLYASNLHLLPWVLLVTLSIEHHENGIVSVHCIHSWVPTCKIGLLILQPLFLLKKPPNAVSNSKPMSHLTGQIFIYVTGLTFLYMLIRNKIFPHWFHPCPTSCPWVYPLFSPTKLLYMGQVCPRPAWSSRPVL